MCCFIFHLSGFKSRARKPLIPVTDSLSTDSVSEKEKDCSVRPGNAIQEREMRNGSMPISRRDAYFQALCKDYLNPDTNSNNSIEE